MSESEEKIHRIEVAVTKIGADVEHLKDRIENGISGTITSINKKLTEEVCPKVSDNCYWIGKIKLGIIQLAVIGLGGMVVMIFLWYHKSFGM